MAKKGVPKKNGSGRGVGANKNTTSCKKGGIGYGKGGKKGKGTGRK